MACDSRKRNCPLDKGMNWQDVDSSEEGNHYPFSGQNIDDTIEDDEESSAWVSCSRIPSSSIGYPPLTVRKLRVNNRLSVNSERSCTIGKKTVLYGQTPKAIRRKQLHNMAEFYGLSLKAFASQMLSETLPGNLDHIRRFHTHSKLELAPFFDDIEKSISPEDTKGNSSSNSSGISSSPNNYKNPNCQSDNGNYTANEDINNTANTNRNDVIEQNVNEETREVIYETEEESFANLGTNYAENPTMPVHDVALLSFGNQRKSVKHFEGSHSGDNSNLQPNRTIISETEESDSDEDLFPHKNVKAKDVSDSPKHFQPVDHCAKENFPRNDAKKQFQHNLKSPKRISVRPLSSSNICDSLISKSTESSKNTNKAMSSHTQFQNGLESMYYNSILDNVLFGDSPKSQVNVSDDHKKGSHVKNMSRPSTSSSEVNNKSQINISGCSDSRNIKDETYMEIDAEPIPSVSYNRVLGQVLFGDSCSASQSRQELIEGKVNDCSNRNSAILSNSPSCNDIISEIFDGPPGNTSYSNCVKKSSHQKSKQPDSCDKNTIHPSSVELSESLWHTLDGSYEY